MVVVPLRTMNVWALPYVGRGFAALRGAQKTVQLENGLDPGGQGRGQASAQVRDRGWRPGETAPELPLATATGAGHSD